MVLEILAGKCKKSADNTAAIRGILEGVVSILTLCRILRGPLPMLSVFIFSELVELGIHGFGCSIFFLKATITPFEPCNNRVSFGHF